MQTSCPAHFDPFRPFPHVGHGVGQPTDPHFDPHQKIKIRNKKALKTEVFKAFWSCYPDLNWGPHPYQGCALPTELQQQMATRKGLEPSTSGVTGRRSNQLNYRAIKCFMMNRSLCHFSGRGRRNRTLGTRFWRPLLYLLSYTPMWWAFTGSNRGPTGYEPVALTN